MPQVEWSSYHAKRLRATKTDNCGVPISTTGNKSMLVTDGLIKASIGLEWEDGEEITQKNGSGKLCMSEKDPSQLKFVTAEIEFCGVNPELLSMITGMPLMVDADGNAVGIALTTSTLEANVAIELWSDVAGVACGAGARPYGYYLLPFLGTGKIGNIELAVGAASFTVTAESKNGSGWGVGPYDVTLNEGATPSDPQVPGPLISALTTDTHFVPMVVTVPPPAITAGAVALPTP